MKAHVMMTVAAVLCTAGFAAAQTSASKTEKTSGTSSFEQTVRLTGEVVYVQGNWLVAKMQPSGNYELFNVQPGREFQIDGQKKLIGDLKPGTSLTAMIITKTTPVTVRTTATLMGTVWWVSGNSVILTHPNGENKKYKVADSYRFIVEGKPASVQELRQGMKVSATKIVEEPQTEISTQTVITGSSPK